MEKVIRCEKVKSSSEIRLGIEGLSKMVKAHKPPPLHVVKIENIVDHDHDDHHDCSVNIPIKPFLSLCDLVLQVLGT